MPTNPAPPLVLAVSRCLLGAPVRYDGGHKTTGWLLEAPETMIRRLPFCPEFEAGLGVPREPIELQRGPGGVMRVIGLVSGRDVTPTLEDAFKVIADRLDGESPEAFVFKSRSPSCAVGSASVDGRADADGLFAAWAAARWPDCPRVDERLLENTEGVRRFFEALRRGRSRRCLGDGPVDAWERWLATRTPGAASAS